MLYRSSLWTLKPRGTQNSSAKSLTVVTGTSAHSDSDSDCCCQRHMSTDRFQNPSHKVSTLMWLPRIYSIYQSQSKQRQANVCVRVSKFHMDPTIHICSVLLLTCGSVYPLSQTPPSRPPVTPLLKAKKLVSCQDPKSPSSRSHPRSLTRSGVSSPNTLVFSLAELGSERVNSSSNGLKAELFLLLSASARGGPGRHVRSAFGSMWSRHASPSLSWLQSIARCSSLNWIPMKCFPGADKYSRRLTY